MKVEFIGRSDLDTLIADGESFIANLESTVYIVRGYVGGDLVDEIKDFCTNFAKKNEDSWHPCVDGIPDYHRIHNNYPKAYVKSIQHAYYYHAWNQNKKIFKLFKSLFDLKVALSQEDIDVEDYFKNIPSQGPIARVVVHQYPRGGGGQEEHVDPTSSFARVQTIIQASSRGDYKEGGFYVRSEEFGVINIDPLTQKGDLILASPKIRHGVAPIDSEELLDWGDPLGRWIIMPIIINSDLVDGVDTKPVGVSYGR
jgi:hypothetical protein